MTPPSSALRTRTMKLATRILRLGVPLAVASLFAAEAVAQGGFAPRGVIVSAYGYGTTNRYFGSSVTLYDDWALIGATGFGATEGLVEVL